MKLRMVSIVLATVVVATLGVAQDNTDKTKAAEAAAEAWLKFVDSGDYSQSWIEASSSFKSHVTQKEWEQKIQAARAPLGALFSRKLKSAEYKTELPGAPDGQYVVVQYDSSFANKKSAVETATAMLDKAEQWRVSGTSFFRRKDALDLLNVIEVVTGEHPHDVLHRFFATLGVDSMVLPLFWRQ